MGLVEGSFAGQKIRVKTMTARRTLGEVERRLDEQLLDEQIVLDGIAKKYRRVDVGVVEGPGVGLVIEQDRPGSAKNLESQPGRAAEPRVGSGMACAPICEPDR